MSSNIRIITPPDTFDAGPGKKVVLINVTLPNLTRAVDELYPCDIDLELYLCNNLNDSGLWSAVNSADKVIANDVTEYPEKISSLKSFVKYQDYKGLVNELSK